MSRNNLRSLRLAACLLNISEARNLEVVRNIAEAAVKDQATWRPSNTRTTSNEIVEDLKPPYSYKACVLNVFSDSDYNRSVITIAGLVDYIESSIVQACTKAFATVDMSNQEGGHPRLGSVDLIPIHPLSSSVSLYECGLIANEIASNIMEVTQGTSFFLFGSADNDNRGLVQRRKEVGWYSGKKGLDYDKLKWDIGGKPTSRYGMTGIGTMPYMMNFNITIDSDDIELGKYIANAIRSSTPKTGCHGVQTMAFHHQGRVEIACNVETCDLQKVDQEKHLFTTTQKLEDIIKMMADEKGVGIFGKSLIGFTPETAYDKTVQALETGELSPWMFSTEPRM